MVVVVCAVNGGVGKVLGEVDDEQGEVGVKRNKTLTRVGTQHGRATSGLKSAKSSLCSCFLRILGIKFGFSKAAGGFGSGFDLIYLGFFLGASFRTVLVFFWECF